jgi:hypothetical protein
MSSETRSNASKTNNLKANPWLFKIRLCVLVPVLLQTPLRIRVLRIVEEIVRL